MLPRLKREGATNADAALTRDGEHGAGPLSLLRARAQAPNVFTGFRSRSKKAVRPRCDVTGA